MTITATIIADSVSPTGKRIITYSLRYPRLIHSELLTHRVFSRSAASSRAIPVKKIIASVESNPAMPIYWGANQAGMQASVELDPIKKATATDLWLGARDAVVTYCRYMNELGLHKQIANRPLETWYHEATVLTATEFGNFFNLRYHTKAQPEIAELARLMWEASNNSTPRKLNYGEWHLPYIRDEEIKAHPIADLLKMSAARCARVSYHNHEGKVPTKEEDFALFERLMGELPKHASPCEHPATPRKPKFGERLLAWVVAKLGFTLKDPLCGNFEGWHQFRKTIPGEYLPVFTKPLD